MSNFLVGHAYRNVWCDPEQDFQHIFMPALICQPAGVMGTVDVLWRTYNLPTTSDTYQVFQIGQINPQALGLEAKINQWESLATVMTNRLVYINVYTTNGINLPLATSYVMFTRDRTLILAVKMWPTIADLTQVDVFFRFYSNAFFNSIRSQGQVNAVTSRFYQHQGSTTAALAYQQLYTTYLAKPGFVVLYKNGRYTGTLNPLTLNNGDILEFIYDSSVKKVVDFPVSQLQTFDSTKDQKIKYLLHYSGAQGFADGTDAAQATIDYRDDIDVFLYLPGTNPDGSSTFDGIYFHKNQDDAFRQVTHRDYSVAVPYVVTYQTSNPTWTNISLLTIRIVIRNAGFDRALISEANRINELYRMPDQDIVNAFLGINSTVQNWRAPTLEDSEYVDIMDSLAGNVTLDMVETAYGYYEIGDILAPSPILMNGADWISLPPGLMNNATMYEYDTNGHLLGWYPHVTGPQYTPVYTGCALVEGMVGPGSSTLSQVMGQNSVPVSANLSYRFYIAPVVNGIVQTGQWQDVTGDTTKYQIVNGNVQWLVNTTAYQTCIKSDAQHLVYQLTLDPPNGVYKFSVNATVSYPSGMVSEVLTIPPGQLDVWLNGCALIENVDFYCVWPQIVIVNKAFLNQDGPQTITVRCSGFCNSNLTRNAAMETDFVRYGVLSHNGVYNVHYGRVMRIVSNGSVWAPSQVIFAEDQIEGTIPNLPNGSPYSITQVVVPTRGFTDQDTYAMLATDAPIDQAVSAYLTEMLPDTYPSTPDIIPDKYAVVSPFSCAIIHDMVNGILPMTNFMGQYSDRDVKNALAAYTYLLAYDPTQMNVDLDHIDIHPHDETTVIQLTIYQYNFLSRAVNIFLNGQVDLSKFLSIVWY
jgi:hypothetical protein